MKRYTQAILATAFLFAAPAISAQGTRPGGEKMLSGTTAGDCPSTYTYDKDNRLTTVESLASRVAFDYTPTTYGNEDYDMTMRISDPSGDIICYIEIGDNGFITKSREIEEWAGEQATYKTFTFAYDADGHLTRINEIGYPDFASTTFEYTDGNITSVAITGSTPADLNISYISDDNPAGIANTAGVMEFAIFGNDDIETGYFHKAGLLGLPTTSLPIRSEMTTDRGTIAHTHIWNTDNEGRPTSRTTISDSHNAVTTGYTWTDTNAAAINMKDTANGEERRYDIKGMRHNNPTRGINIVITPEGSVKKTLYR